MNKYESILNYDYHMKHKRMSINERSYEFAPFSALVGFTDLIKERERETISKKILTDEEKEILNNRIKLISDKLSIHPKVIITYFVKDKTKDGGAYQTINDYIKKIDFYHKLIIFENKERINFENIVNIDSLDIDLSEFLS